MLRSPGDRRLGAGHLAFSQGRCRAPFRLIERCQHTAGGRQRLLFDGEFIAPGRRQPAHGERGMETDDAGARTRPGMHAQARLQPVCEIVAQHQHQAPVATLDRVRDRVLLEGERNERHARVRDRRVLPLPPDEDAALGQHQARPAQPFRRSVARHGRRAADIEQAHRR